MKKIILYCIVLLVIFIGCEDVYNPDIEQVENVLVIDARIEASGSGSYVRLSKSLGFNDPENGYPPVQGATVSIISSDKTIYNLYETINGYYPMYFNLNPEFDYKLKVGYAGHVYESDFLPVPKMPDLDTVYGIPETKKILMGGEKNIDDAIEKVGVQLYTNILNEKEMPYYKFTARKILEYTYTVNPQNLIVIYGWNSSFPSETFNIAAPPEFSVTTDILKHPLFFIGQKPDLSNDHVWNEILQTGETFYIGYILIVYQHGLSNTGYNYYKDLNSQLNSEGRLFDPLYIQPNSNLKCISDPEQLVLGNFEISRVKEHRFYVRYASEKIGYRIQPINTFYYIPLNGETSVVPDFWEPKNN